MKSIKDLNEEKEKIKKYSEPDNPLQNIADDVGKTQIDSQIEILKEVLEYANKRIEELSKVPNDDFENKLHATQSILELEWLILEIKGDDKQESEGGTKT